LIINGLLTTDYGDDSHYASVINVYSPSMQKHYFRGVPNTVCLGDPRMDSYPPAPRRRPGPGKFTIVIGAGGHNPTDLNSYVAVEFDFLHDVLAAASIVKSGGVDLTVIIKVRANGYAHQYEQFAREYFPDLVGEIIAEAPMRAVLDRADFFVSIFSQTLFEASCMGIPVAYYRVGDRFKYEPFDGESELVTLDTVESLVQAIEDARAGHARFDPFLDRDVMARYIGPLDGRNVARNMEFIYKLLDSGRETAAA
jgi:hypothetical protein